jgi:hypothetical protein
MDATRSRRSRDFPRQRWYARWRSLRFARHLGFLQPDEANPSGPCVYLPKRQEKCRPALCPA